MVGVAALGRDDIALAFRFDAFGHDPQAERPRHGDDSPEYRPVALVRHNPLHHRAVELEIIERQYLEITEVAETRPEIVEPDADPGVLESSKRNSRAT